MSEPTRNTVQQNLLKLNEAKSPAEVIALIKEQRVWIKRMGMSDSEMLASEVFWTMVRISGRHWTEAFLVPWISLEKIAAEEKRYLWHGDYDIEPALGATGAQAEARRAFNPSRYRRVK